MHVVTGPLDSAQGVHLLIAHTAVIAELSLGYSAHFRERIGRAAPSGKEFVAHSEHSGQIHENVEIGFGFPRRRHGLLHPASAALAVGITAALLTPHSRWQDQVGQLGSRRRVETVLHYEQIEARERLAQPFLIGKAGQRIGGNHPQCLDAAR